MKWHDYANQTASAIQKGSVSALHALEGTLATYGTLQAGYQLATQLGSGIRAVGSVIAPAVEAAAPAAAAAVLL